MLAYSGFLSIAMFRIPSFVDIDVPTIGLLAEPTNSFALLLAILNNKS